MASIEEICSAALGLIGQNPITDINDSSPSSVRCRQIFALERDSLLRLHEWNFACRRAALSPDAVPPAFGYAYQFSLPGDCLRVLELQDRTIEYKIEGRSLLSDSAEISIKYISRIEESGFFDSSFCTCFAARLASRLVSTIKVSAALTQAMMSLAEIELRNAKAADASEGSPRSPGPSSWLDAR